MSIGIKRLIIPHYLLKADIYPLETSPFTNSTRPLLALELEDTSLAEYWLTLIRKYYSILSNRKKRQGMAFTGVIGMLEGEM